MGNKRRNTTASPLVRLQYPLVILEPLFCRISLPNSMSGDNDEVREHLKGSVAFKSVQYAARVGVVARQDARR